MPEVPKIVDLAVLASEGTSAKAYLEAFRRAGLQPAKILDLRLIPDYPLTKRAARFLGKPLTWWLIQTLRRLRFHQRAMYAMSTAMQKPLGKTVDFFESMSYESYSQDVDHLYAVGLEDPELVAYMAAQSQQAWLYATSGLMPAVLLQLPNKRFIHIHPGVVPYVRGSDCLLWSCAIRGKPGMSSFYMNEGIDTGQVIATREFTLPHFELDSNCLGTDQIYNGLLAFYDVLLRGEMLEDLLRKYGATANYADLSCHSQDPNEGRTYFTMHPSLRARVLQELFLK